MRRIAMLGLTILTAVALAAIASSAAFAVELPEYETQTNFTGTSGSLKLNLAGAGIKCTSASTTGTASSKTHATGDMDITGCTLGGEECHSLGDPSGKVLVELLFIMLRLKSGSAGELFGLDKELHLECKFASTLILIAKENASNSQGILGIITPILTATKEYKAAVNVNAGVQEATQFETDTGEKVTVKFEGSVNGGAFKAATLEQANNAVTTAATTKIVKTT
jgi:hypothetical protein